MKVTGVTVTARLYLTADGQRVVAEGDKAARVLFAAVGDKIPPRLIAKFRLDQDDCDVWGCINLDVIEGQNLLATARQALNRYGPFAWGNIWKAIGNPSE